MKLMINILPSHAISLIERLKEFQPDRQTYLVADLQTKSKVQQILLETNPCLPEDSVLRMSEWLRKLLFRNGHMVEIVSPTLVSAILAEWLKSQNNQASKFPGSAQLLLHYIGELLPILQSEERIEQVREWLGENPNVLLRWGFWFEQSVVAWRFFKSQRIITHKWLGGFISGQEKSNVWSRDLFVDVGPDLAGVEVEILSELSKQISITVYSPPEQFLEKYKETLWPYSLLLEQNMVTSAGDSLEGQLSGDGIILGLDESNLDDGMKSKIKCAKFTTQIAEVKSATSQIRQWLEQGVQPHAIGVVAADIESYWPTLSEYLSVEGVPVHKDVVVTAVMLPKTAQWFSRMKIELQSVESSHLESVVFQADKEPQINFEKYRQLFSKIYDFEDLERDRQIQKIFELKLNSSQRIKRDEFATWALRYIEGDIGVLEPILTQLLLECPSQTILEAMSWLDYLAQIAVQVEIPLEQGDTNGIACENLSAARNLDLEKIIVLGLSEKKLNIQSQTNISASDVQKLNQDLGISLNSPNRRYFEYLVDNLLWSSNREIDFYFSGTNFRGDPESPSRIWLEESILGGEGNQSVQVPGQTRWDEIQANQLDVETKKWVDQDMGPQRDRVSSISRDLQYSVSQIEKYLQCPFVFLSEKIFHLSDLPDVDLDIDAMTSGRIMHAILERIVTEPFVSEVDQSELDKLIDEIQDKMGLPIGHRALWAAQKKSYIATALRFLEFEKKWRSDFPETTTVAKELRVKGEFEIADNRKVKFAGQIDRIDTRRQSQNLDCEYVIVDYKSSPNGLKNHGSWIGQNELQLLFYSAILDSGLVELPRGHVVGAFYFALKSMDREKGMRLSNHDGALFNLNPKSSSRIELSDYSELKNQLKKTILNVVDAIEGGEFSPIPSDKKDCDRCNWRTLCRAAHLN